MSLAREVGRRIRALRRRRGLTQAALAERIDRSEVALRAIERGASAPSFATLERLVQALDVPAAGLFPPLRKGDDARPETERRAREVAAVTALAHSFDDPDLALALALLGAVAEAASAPPNPMSASRAVLGESRKPSLVSGSPSGRAARTASTASSLAQPASPTLT